MAGQSGCLVILCHAIGFAAMTLPRSLVLSTDLSLNFTLMVFWYG